MRNLKKMVVGVAYASAMAMAIAATYPSVGNGTEPNVWTRNYSGVLAAAQTTGYPILLLIVNSAGCSHCHAMMNQTVNTAEFAAMERDLVFYKVMMDQANGGGDWSKVLRKYQGYFNYGMYPLAAVIRWDGSVYGSFGNRATDKRNVTAEVRNDIEQLAVEQGSGEYTPLPVNPVTPPSLTAEQWAAKLKGKTNGLLFDSSQNMVGSFLLNVTTKGKVNVKVTTISGRATFRGKISAVNDTAMIKSDELNFAYDAKTGVWSGTCNGYSAYGRNGVAKDCDGLYTARANGAGGEKVGYVTLTLRNGKGSVSGLLNGRNKVTARDVSVLLPAALVAAELPNWDCGVDLVFVPAVKRGLVTGGVAVSKEGSLMGGISGFGSKWNVAGSKFTVSSLAPLEGKRLRIQKGSDVVEFPIRLKDDRRIYADDNEYQARISATFKRGIFRGGAKIDGVRISFEGAIIKEGAALVGAGVTYGAGGVHAVTIE